MEPCAPGTEDEPPIMYSTLTKQENEQERLLSQKAFLRNGRYDNVFELSYQNGAECWFCKVCECPVMGRVFQHEIGKRHSQNLESTNRHMDKDRRDEPASEPVTLDIAPGEPVPPGFEDEVIAADSLIQERLDGFKAGPLVALEYLLELQDDDPSKEPIYLCILCDKKGDPRTVLTHLASYNHISQYLQKHFPTCWRLLVPYMTKQYKRNYQITLQKIGEGIEKKFGRLKPYPIDKDKFEKDRMHYLQIVGKGRHFSEQSGYTFEELVVHDELTKTYEDTADKTYETSTTNNWGNTTFIQKPFKKRSPSPPVVGAPRKKANKGNAQTNPRRQEPAYVPLSQQQQQAKPQPPKQQLPPQQTGVAPGAAPAGRPTPAGRPAVRGGQRSRRSVSSVSSISSSDMSDSEKRNDRRDRHARNNRPPFNRNDRNVRNDRNNDRNFGRNFDRNGRLPYTRRRSVSPQRRQPSPRRRSPSPKRRTPSPKRVEREKEAEKVRKMEEFKKLGRAIENDLQKTLKQHEKNPEKHPQYSDEWKQFWNRRYKELKAEGVDVSKYDFKPEWIEFWNKRMVELHSDELRSRKEALRRRLGLDEINPIKFKIGGGPNPPVAAAVVEKASPKRLPMAAQPDQNDDDDDEVIFIDDKEEEERIRVGSSRSRSPWEKETSPVRRKRSPPPHAVAAAAPAARERRRSRERSPVRPAKRSRSKDRYPVRSKSGERNISRERNLTRAPPKVVSPRREPSRTKDPPRDIRVDRDYRQSRERASPSPASSRRRRSASPRERRSRSRERSWERREAERKRLEYRESSFERDLRGRERVRTVADLPWEREKNYRRPYEFYEPPPMIMREATRMPVLEPPILLPPEDDDDEGEVNVVDVLRILTALEERLGSLGPKIIDLLAQALALEKKEANSSETLLDNDINCVLFETIKEKLKGQMLAGLVDMIQERAFKKAIRKIAGLIHLAGQRKRQRDKLMPKVAPVKVPGVGTVDKAAIAKQIASALIMQGKTDVTQGELETLINAVVGMAEASKNSNKPMTTAGFLQQLTGGSSGMKDEPEEKIIIPTSAKKSDLVDLEKLTEPLTPSPGKTPSSNMENLSDSDLQTLLQNFKDLSTDEQHNLINYLKKLEYQEPERVERLRKFVNLDPTGKIKDDTSETTDTKKKEKGTRESPFSNRFGSTNPMLDNLTQIESDEEDMETEEDKPENKEKQDKQEKVHVDSEEDDYTFEDVVKTVSKTVKDKEIAHSKKIVEESMKFGNKPKPGEELSNAKSLISSLMSNISNSGSIDLLGLGTKQLNTPTTASSIDLTKLGNFSVASLASIMSNVNSTASTEDDKKLNFEPPSPTGKVKKLNIDPAQLERPNSPSGPGRVAIGPDRGFTDRGPLAPERNPERGYDRGFNTPGFDRAPDRSFGGPDRSFGVPDRSFGGPDRGFGGPDRSFGGPDRGFGGPDRGYGGPDRSFGGPDRPFGGADRSPGDRPPLGPDRSFGGPDRSFGGPDRSFGGPDRSFGGPDRSFGGPDRSFGGPDRSFGGPDRSFGGPDRSFGGPDRMGDLGGSFGGPDRSDRPFGGTDRAMSGQSFGGPGPNRGPLGPGGPSMGPAGQSGPNMGPGGQSGPNMGNVGQSGPNMGPRGPVGQNVSSRGPIRLNLAPRGPGFGNDMPNQRLPRPVLDQRNNPRFGFGGSDFGRNGGGNFNRW